MPARSRKKDTALGEVRLDTINPASVRGVHTKLTGVVRFNYPPETSWRAECEKTRNDGAGMMTMMLVGNGDRAEAVVSLSVCAVFTGARCDDDG